MNLTTQLTTTKESSIKSLREKLEAQDIKVAHPTRDEPIFYENENDPWSRYESQLNLFESIAMSSFHIVMNEGALTNDAGLQILYALIKNKPVIMLQEPTFEKSVDALTREIITSHITKLQVADLNDMEPAEISFLLKNLPEHIDYQLTAHQEALIKSHVKAHFRSLLEGAKTALLAPAMA